LSSQYLILIHNTVKETDMQRASWSPLHPTRS